MGESLGDRVTKAYIIGAIVIFLALGTVFVGLRISIYMEGDSVETFDLWDAKCPFGHYYTDVEGGGFIFFHIESSLGEGYVFKFFDNGQLKTLIVDAVDDDVHVYLTEDSSRMWMVVKFEGNTFETDDSGEDDGQDWLWMEIYVPDPKLAVEA